jgi:hypothetical protein
VTEKIFTKLYGGFMNRTARQKRRSQQKCIDGWRDAYMGGMADPASRLVLAVFVGMDHDLDQKYEHAAGNRQR